MQIQFDASRVAPSQPFVPLDAGWYNVRIIEQEQKPTKDNAQTGNWYLKLTLEVIDGQAKGRKLFHNLNIGHQTSEDARRIAYEQLSAICHATGRLQIGDTRELNGLPIACKVSLKTDPSGNYEPSNEVKGFKAVEQGGPSMGGNGPAFGGGGFQAQAPAPAPAPAPAQGFGAQQPQFTSQQPAFNGQGQQGGFQAPPPSQPQQQQQPMQQHEAAPVTEAAPMGKAPWET